jgi:hypothetical protein
MGSEDMNCIQKLEIQHLRGCNSHGYHAYRQECGVNFTISGRRLSGPRKMGNRLQLYTLHISFHRMVRLDSSGECPREDKCKRTKEF